MSEKQKNVEGKDTEMGRKEKRKKGQNKDETKRKNGKTKERKEVHQQEEVGTVQNIEWPLKRGDSEGGGRVGERGRAMIVNLVVERCSDIGFPMVARCAFCLT